MARLKRLTAASKAAEGWTSGPFSTMTVVQKPSPMRRWLYPEYAAAWAMSAVRFWTWASLHSSSFARALSADHRAVARGR
jgi:hypothetical protein